MIIIIHKRLIFSTSFVGDVKKLLRELDIMNSIISQLAPEGNYTSSTFFIDLFIWGLETILHSVWELLSAQWGPGNQTGTSHVQGKFLHLCTLSMAICFKHETGCFFFHN